MNKSNIVAPYGSWKSPITTDLIISKTIGLMDIRVVDDSVYWLESRPEENGRYVIVRKDGNCAPQDINPPPFNARTRVQEYGGASYWVDDGTVFFSNFVDHRIYRKKALLEPEPITGDGLYYYADAVIDRKRRRLICIREDHTRRNGEAITTLVSISLDSAGLYYGDILVQGSDFYSSPRLSPDGTQLAWISWCHPNMPWDGCELWVARLDTDGTPCKPEIVAGGATESILQPEWSPDGTLHFISDRSGWYNIYRWRDSKVEAIIEMAAEFGSPPWLLGDSSYAFESAQQIICTYNNDGVSHLANIDASKGRLETFQTPYTSFSSLRVSNGRVIFLSASPFDFLSVVECDLQTHKLEILCRSSDVNIESAYVSAPLAIKFPTENELEAHAFYYSPKNCDYIGPDDERPPLLVMSHGGPTSSCDSTLKLTIQYWTSRGIAVLDVNYGGSAGYGRAYRERLNKLWGIVDVNDCINGARYIVQEGLIDKNRLAIRGGSAGGFTTLRALTVHNVFKAGASYAGVSDLEAFVKETHKFESHYLDKLIGPYPKRADLYRQRSPINAVDSLSCPLILFQGLEDKIVLPTQAEKIFEVLREKGVPVAYLAFKDEQHGFRSADSIKRALEAELYFYSRIFNFELADPTEPIHIYNL